MPDAVERAAAALHLARVVDDARPEGGHERLDLGRLQRVVPAHGRLRPQQVAAVVHGQAHAAQGADAAACHRGRALHGGEVLREVVHLQALRPGEALVGEGLVHRVAPRTVQCEVALGLLEGGVAAVARGEQVETGAADDGQVAGGDGVVEVGVAGLDQRALGAAGVTLEFVRLYAEVLEDEACGLLDRREARGDRAPPEHRVVPHAASYLTSSPLRSIRPPGTETLPDRTLRVPPGSAVAPCTARHAVVPPSLFAEPSSANGSALCVTRPSASRSPCPQSQGP